jgi:hypothetical protein
MTEVWQSPCPNYGWLRCNFKMTAISRSNPLKSMSIPAQAGNSNQLKWQLRSNTCPISPWVASTADDRYWTTGCKAERLSYTATLFWVVKFSLIVTPSITKNSHHRLVSRFWLDLTKDTAVRSTRKCPAWRNRQGSFSCQKCEPALARTFLPMRVENSTSPKGL